MSCNSCIGQLLSSDVLHAMPSLICTGFSLHDNCHTGQAVCYLSLATTPIAQMLQWCTHPGAAIDQACCFCITVNSCFINVYCNCNIEWTQLATICLDCTKLSCHRILDWVQCNEHLARQQPCLHLFTICDNLAPYAMLLYYQEVE